MFFFQQLSDIKDTRTLFHIFVNTFSIIICQISVPHFHRFRIKSQHVHSKAEPHNNRHWGHTVPTLSYTRVHQVLLEHWLCVAILTEVWRGLIETGGEYTEAKAPRKKVQCPTAEEGCSRNEEKNNKELNKWFWNDTTSFWNTSISLTWRAGDGRSDVTRVWLKW